VSTTDAIRERWAEMKAGRPRPERGDDGLTSIQRDIFRRLYEGARDDGFQRSIRELCAERGWVSPNALEGHLKALERKGWIHRGDGCSRAIRFLKTPSGSPFRGFRDQES
jgi:SOS-response transcriptional repressor LexA